MSFTIALPSGGQRNSALLRGIGAGLAWGVVLGAGLTAVSAFGCGTVCLGDAILTTGFAALAGIGTIAPVVALLSRE